MVGQKQKKYREILKQKIGREDDLARRTKYEIDLVTGYYMPQLIEGECPNCGIRLAIHDFCVELRCPVCAVLMET